MDSAPDNPGLTPTWDDLPDGVVVADADGTVVVFNRAAARITGLSTDEVLGKKITDALPLEDLEGRHWWVCTDPYGGLSTRTRQPERELLLPGARPVLVTASFVRPPDGRPGLARLVVGLRDTTSRERLERGRAELVSTVAHELRSPLTSVKGFTATLLAKWERFTDEQRRLMLETVNADADRVTRLITELLDISRIDAGRVQLRKQVIDVAAIARRLVGGQVATGLPPERFVVDAGPDLPELWADPDKIEQVLANLIENGVRHGAGTVTVRMEAAEVGGEPGVRITVCDEGEGIPEALRGRVFTKFWRSGKRGGTGLGLYIVRGLVQAHGGEVAVDRHDGSGARFTVRLPAGAPDLPEFGS